MKRIPPQRPRTVASQPQSPNIIQNYGNKAGGATSDTYSYSLSRRNNSKSNYKASESSQHQQCALSNSSDGVPDSSHENSDDDFEVDSRKTRRTENQVATGGPQRHQHSLGPRPTSSHKRDLGKKTSKALPEQQAQSDYNETLDEHWPSFPDQMDFDYKLDSDSPLESSPIMRTTGNTQSALPSILDANHDTIDDIDELLMEDASSPRSRIPSNVRSTKRQDDVPETKAPKSKNGQGDAEDKSTHKDKSRPGDFTFENDEYIDDERKLESKTLNESKTKDRGSDAQLNSEDPMSVCQDTDRNKALDQAMGPLMFDIPVGATDFKSRLGGKEKWSQC
ncbi:hypothetical protein BGZ80_005612 [Entomortierella chlamydospora]|uniref:Uncharacterized protein n=1 Tax=Entomortierella chlamydospora TaxID=101097 RepID=A0A9P6MJ51_9FUNG|nr:hypothetical protein BGZ80_005612 [Entomortierella chlamydospora]